MWLFDICYDIYSRDAGRRIFIVKRSSYDANHCYCGNISSFKKERFSQRRWDRTIYTVVEEWQTPESQGDTGDFDFYTFMTYQDAAIFIAQLCMKFNTPMQRQLMQAAENLATDITKEHKKAVKQLEAEEKKKNTASRKKTA